MSLSKNTRTEYHFSDPDLDGEMRAEEVNAVKQWHAVSFGLGRSEWWDPMLTCAAETSRWTWRGASVARTQVTK